MSRRYIPILLFVLCQLLLTAQNDPSKLRPVLNDSIYSENLKEYRQFFIQYPQEYDESSTKKYPVAFILDGEFLLPTVTNFQGYYSGGFTPEMILIGISNLKNRTRDLTTSKITESYGMPYTRENGEASNFIKFIGDELIPHIENSFPVTKYRTLIGHSYGGLFTVYTLLYHPELFSNYIAIDPSLDWDNQKLITEAKELLQSNTYKGKSLFMSLNGQLHMQDPTITIDNVMEDNSDFTVFARSNIFFRNCINENQTSGIKLSWKFYPMDLHGTIQFPSIRDGLVSTFEWYQMEDTYRINSFDTPNEELYKIIKNRENKLEEHFGYFVPPYPEDLLNILGYMSMDMNNPNRAKMLFELAIDYYPSSANVYDSMADYYERNNDKNNALNFTEKAFSINKSDELKQKIERLKKE